MGEASSEQGSASAGLIKEEQREEGGWKLPPVRGGSTCAVMDKYRPKRPTTLALFPQLPQAGTQVGRLGGSTAL